MEEALPLSVCPASHHHPGGEFWPHNMDPEGDVVQYSKKLFSFIIYNVPFIPHYKQRKPHLERLDVIDVIL